MSGLKPLHRSITSALIAGFWLAFQIPAAAITVSLEYENNSDPFFTPQARATMQKAADDVSFAISSTLTALGTNQFTGVNGETSVSADWAFLYDSPSTGNPAPDFTQFNFGFDEFRVVVGSRAIAGGALGLGGPAGAGLAFDLSGFEFEWAGAVAAMESASNAAMPRGGPILGTFSGVLGFNDEDEEPTYLLEYGYSLGALTIDNTTAWHLDHTTQPGAGQFDLYSVAVHELLHTIGFGTSDPWFSLVSGTNWLGPAVISLHGTGVNVLEPDEVHIRDGLMGRPLIDGVFAANPTQDAIMVEAIAPGVRRYVTDLDLAFLADIGWAVVPEPSGIFLLVMGAFAAVIGVCRTRSRSQRDARGERASG